MSVDITLQARDRISQQIDAITKSVGELNRAFEELEQKSNNAGNKAKLSLDKVASASKTVGKGLTTVGSGLTKYITKPALAAGAALSGIVLAKGFSRFTQIDEATAKLRAMGLTAAQASTIINENAKEAVLNTAYNLDEAATTAAGAFAADIKGKDLTKYLTTITDAAAVAGVSMEEMGIIFNRVAANGKVTAMEMNQLADRGIPIWKYMAKETGKSVEDVRKAVSKGEISLEDFRGAIDHNIGGAAKEMGKISWSGMVSNIEASIGRIGANIWGTTDDVNSLSHVLLRMGNAAMGPLSKVEEKAQALGKTIGTTARLMFEYLRTGDVDLFAFTDASESVQQFFVKLMPLLDTLRDVSATLKEMPTGKKLSIAGFAVGLGPALKLAGKLSTTFGTVAPIIGKAVKNMGGFKGVLKAITSPLSIGVALFAGMYANSENFRNAVSGLFETLGPKISEAFTTLQPMLSTIFDTLGQVLGDLGDAFAPLIAAAAPVLSALCDLFGTVDGAITPIISTIADLVSWFSSKMSQPAQAAASVISGAFKGVAGVINAVASAINAVKSAWDSIKSGSKTLTIYQKTVGAGKAINGGNGLAGPKFATGTKTAPGGTALVGERGPELVDLPKGASVHTARDTEKALSSQSININMVNNVSNEGMSIDQLVSQLSQRIAEAMASGAEGAIA